MNIIGVIGEYNPFHNGHLYHLHKIKEMFPDSLIILILNGYFLERGEISILSKEDKTNIALHNGIDLVIELPFIFGTQSADTFADASLKLLNELKCEYLIFGSEENNIQKLIDIAKYSLNSKEYNNLVKDYLDKGDNYPTSLAKALKTDINLKPNDLLGVSYVKAILKNNYNIKPLTIKRTNDYLDTTSDNEIISAMNIREKLKNNLNIDKYIPYKINKYLNNISYSTYFNLLKYKIITSKDLSIYLDVDEGIENRLKKGIMEANNYEELISKLKTKRYTYNKIRRMLLHILLGLTKEERLNLDIEYLKILGFNKKGAKYLNKIKKEIVLPTTSIKNSLTYNFELKASLIYDLLTNSNKNYKFEINNKPLKINEDK